MSEPIYQIQKDVELNKRGIDSNTIISPDNHQIILTKNTLLEIANKISERINRKLTPDEITNLIKYIKEIKADRLFGIKLNAAINKITNAYLSRKKVERDILIKEMPTNPIELTKLDEITDIPTIDEYQKKEIKQFTKDENQNKYAAFADRRGNAVVDYNKVNNNSSSPDSYPSGFRLTPEEINKANYETLKTVKNFLDPESIDDLLNRFSNSYTNFFSINLPHQNVPLDSRNRLLTNPSLTEYTWNIHTAGKPGFQGDIKVQDTIQQAIQMKIGSFWLPMYPIVGSYYNKIRMLVKEFTSQSIMTTEFLDADTTEPTVNYFHFEFNIIDNKLNKVLLQPVNDTYTFRKPFARIETLTITFRTPFDQLVFVPDRGVYTITYGNPTILTITSGPSTFISTGDLIYITNSHSGNATIDNILNRTSGYIATKISNTQFSIAVDTSILGGTETNINVYYGSQRIFFDLEFLTLEQ